MADQEGFRPAIDIPGVGPVEFPLSMTDAQVQAASTRLYQDANPGKKQPPTTSWTDAGSLALAAVRPTLSGIKTVAEELATRPGLAKTAGTIGEVAGGVGGAVSGHGNPISVVGGMMAGKRTGSIIGQTAQRLAGPVAQASEAVMPYAQAASTLSGATGVGDIAQMAEPNRVDIGTLGVGGNANLPNQQASVMAAQIKNMMAQGKTQAEATRTVYNAWAKFLSEQRK